MKDKYKNPEDSWMDFAKAAWEDFVSLEGDEGNDDDEEDDDDDDDEDEDEDGPPSKTCKRCAITKELDEKYFRFRKKDRCWEGVCKACHLLSKRKKV